METASRTTILRIELWHGLLVLAVLGILGPAQVIEPLGLVIGGLFMAINFFLLSYGVGLVLTPLAGRGRVKLGVGLLVLKVVMLLGLLTTLFWRFEIDALSFAVGFSTLFLAILFEVVAKAFTLGTS
jgi:hypothetical protein